VHQNDEKKHNSYVAVLKQEDDTTSTKASTHVHNKIALSILSKLPLKSLKRFTCDSHVCTSHGRSCLNLECQYSCVIDNSQWCICTSNFHLKKNSKPKNIRKRNWFYG